MHSAGAVAAGRSAGLKERHAKRMKDIEPSDRTIGTHNGHFQADEALAVWFLRQLPEYAKATVLRTRSTEVLEKMDIVVDVGGIYDPSRKRFDHHQRGFFETVDGGPGKADGPLQATGRFRTKLSSAGLVYKHFGRAIIKRIAETGDMETELVWAEIYQRFLEALDAQDNGIEVCDGAPRYVDNSGLSSRVARLNQRWNEEFCDEVECARFEQASTLCGNEFMDVLSEVVEAWLPAREKVTTALATRSEVHPSGAILLVQHSSLPWREHIYSLEKEIDAMDAVKFVLYRDQAGMWRVQAVTVEGTLFTNRVSLPEPWRGLRDDALVAACGIPGACFVHANGFIGGHKSFEGALQMAAKALDL